MEKNINSQQNLKETELYNGYYPGKLLIIMNEYFNNQKNCEKVCKNIFFWESYVSHYFSQKINYCIIMNQEGNQWVFRSGYDTLPLIFKEKFGENKKIINICLDGVNEYILAPIKDEGTRYMLKVDKLSIIEKYGECFILTEGVLTVIFDKYLKIINYEFQTSMHKRLNNDENNDLSSLNDFGLTPQFSRTLVISEVLTEMNESINEFIEKFN